MATYTFSRSQGQMGAPDPARAWTRSFGRVLLLIAVCVVCGFIDVPLVLGLQHPAADVPSVVVAAAPLPASRVTRAELGADWPLTVASADVGCRGPVASPTLWVEAKGVRYALNAKAAEQPGSFAPLDGIWLRTLGSIGEKLSTARLQERAQALCR